MLAQVGQHQIVAHGRDGEQARLSKLTFHVIFRGKAVAAMRCQAGIGGFPCSF